MSARSRLAAFVAATALVAACGHDPFGPADIAGTWISAWPTTMAGITDPDTLILDSRGGGRIALRIWLDPVTPGGAPTQAWGAGDVQYRIQRDDVFLRWCVQVPGRDPAACPADGYALAGGLRRDGMLWIGPTSMVSSMAYLPWQRAAGPSRLAQ
jgi:hypothetical protein